MSRQRWLVIAGGMIAGLLAVNVRASAQGPEAKSGEVKGVEVKAVLLKVSERAEIPAQQAGTLLEMPVAEGTTVSEGDILARIDDVEARITVRRAELELQIASRKARHDVEVRAATEEQAVAETDLRLARQARERLADSVSPAELEHLRLKSALAALQVERARHDQEVAKLTEQQRTADLELAQRILDQRRVAAPFQGMVVEVYRQKGEWVEPGERILRLIRLDRIRAEGFVDAQQAGPTLVGRTAQLRVDLPQRAGARFEGKVLYVSPEVDPVNRQTRVTAEFDNRDLLLQPGLRGSMTIGTRP